MADSAALFGEPFKQRPVPSEVCVRSGDPVAAGFDEIRLRKDEVELDRKVGHAGQFLPSPPAQRSPHASGVNFCQGHT